jgi:hypothetical protein
MRIAKLLLVAAAAFIGSSSIGLCQNRSNSMKDEISFEHTISPIVNNFCTTCHAGDDPDGEFVLTSYESVRAKVEDGSLLERINDTEDPMPPSGMMPKHMRRMIKLWSETGFKDKGNPRSASEKPVIDYGDFKPPKITPVDINENKIAFRLLEKVQGHWVGSMRLMGQDYEWMAFDFRAIEKSHIHAIFEGGSIGNLFTSFFVTNYNGKRTIMARNGGILNGIYRTSYFVLDKAQQYTNDDGKEETHFRFIDAYGGKDIMYMELTFAENWMVFSAYTSRMGLNFPAKPHMEFQGERMNAELAKAAAKKFGFPKDELDIDFAKGIPKPNWGSDDIPQTSASYIWEEPGKSIEELGKIARDPYPIDKMPYLAKLTVKAERNEKTEGKPLLIFLSAQSLTDVNGKLITKNGFLQEDVANSLLMFPEITGEQNEFTFTYLHPGQYYLTVIADMNGDSFPTPGDLTHPSKKITVKPRSNDSVKVTGIEVQN